MKWGLRVSEQGPSTSIIHHCPPSTNRGQGCLTLVNTPEPVCPTWHGHWLDLRSTGRKKNPSQVSDKPNLKWVALRVLAPTEPIWIDLEGGGEMT